MERPCKELRLSPSIVGGIIIMNDTTTLYRSIGQQEIDLTRERGYLSCSVFVLENSK